MKDIKLDQLKQRGVKLICYLSVGSWEEWRPDVNRFPPEVLGKDYEGWPGEKFVRIVKVVDEIIMVKFGL